MDKDAVMGWLVAEIYAGGVAEIYADDGYVLDVSDADVVCEELCDEQ